MKKRKNNIVYSTNPDYKYEDEDEQEYILKKQEQKLKIHLNRHKADRFTVSIKNFIGSQEEIKKLSKLLKQKCGVGGSVKNKEIIIQGNIREKIIRILNKEGYQTISVGG